MESILEVLTPDNLVFIFKGFGLTLYISLIAIVLSTLIGTVLAVMRNGKNPILRIISSIYIEFVRNVPNLLWIFTIFLVFKMKSTPAGITAFTLFTSAALAEIIRGGLNAVDKGQYEAGLVIGMTELEVFRRIVIPQAFRVALPSLSNSFIGTMKGTSLGFTIGVVEIMAQAKLLASKNYRVMESYMAALIIYWIIVILLVRVQKIIENKLNRAY